MMDLRHEMSTSTVADTLKSTDVLDKFVLQVQRYEYISCLHSKIWILARILCHMILRSRNLSGDVREGDGCLRRMSRYRCGAPG